jgi:foldase protein PrsA
LRILLLLIAGGILIYLVKSIFIAAFVNGRPISRIALIQELEKQGGQKVLDSLVEKSLILQEASKEGIKISKDDIDAEISRIEALLKDQNLSLEEALSMRGETRASLSEQIKLQKTVEALLAQKISVTDEEVRKYFDENVDLFGAEAKFEDVKTDAGDQLYQQKLNSEYSKWIEELRQKAKIIYLLNF